MTEDHLTDLLAEVERLAPADSGSGIGDLMPRQAVWRLATIARELGAMMREERGLVSPSEWGKLGWETRRRKTGERG